MSLIVVEHASLGFGGQQIFSDLNLRIGQGERIGLVGPNGAGKSTLLRAMMGGQALDGGEVRRSKECRIGYLPQDVMQLAAETLLRSVLATVPGRADIGKRLGRAEQRLGETDDPDEQMEIARTLSELNERLLHFDTYYSEHQAMRILVGLGFSEGDFERPTAELSGGWKMRAALAGLLFQQPDVLFLDEPTNHLDVPSVLWLDEFLRELPGSMVLICHDRKFLNRHIERVISFEPEGVRSYNGDYDSYLEQRAAEEEVLSASRRNRERELKELERFVERFKAKATKARQAQSRARRIKRLQQELAEDQPIRQPRRLDFSFPAVQRTGRDVVKLEGVSKSFGELTLYRDLTRGIYAGDRIAIVGVNGAGKTTLLKLIAQELEPDSGTIRYGANVEVGYYAQHHTELLDPQSTVVEEVRRMMPTASESFVRGVCGAFLFSGDEVEKAVGVLSGGERARVLLARLLINPGNLLLMDEPTNHLDIAAAEALASALESYGGTLVFVSHNTAFVDRLATKVWDIAEGGVIEYPGTLQEYLEHLRRRQEEREADEQSAAAAIAEAEADKSAARKAAPKPSRGTAPNAKSGAPGAAEPADSGETRGQRKDRKRRQARKRNERSRKSRDMRREIEKLEQRIAELEQAQKDLEPKLADPELYGDGQRFRQTLERYDENRGKIDELYARWEYRQKELDELLESLDG